MKHNIQQYDTTGASQFEPSWYATVWASELMLKIQVKGLPFNTVFHMDKKAIPQLINALQAIQNERTN